MNVVRLDAHRDGSTERERTAADGLEGEADATEALLTDLRMHDQMLSCLHFVSEQATRLYPADTELAPIDGSIELVAAKRAELAAELARLGVSETADE